MKILKDKDNESMKILKDILKELRDNADEAGRIVVTDTATTTKFFIINTSVSPGHNVKGYKATNNGPNSLFVAHNAAPSAVGPDITDVTLPNAIFEELSAGDDTEVSYNRQGIRNIWLRASGGPTAFSVKLVW
jgi:hypothetical protein